MNFRVLYLDCLGHSSSECQIYGCACVRERIEIDGSERILRSEHDDDRCNCHYEINALHKTYDLKDYEGEDDKALLFALIEDGFLMSSRTLETISFEDFGNG